MCPWQETSQLRNPPPLLKPGYGRGPQDEHWCAKSSYRFYIRASMGRSEVILDYSSFSPLFFSLLLQRCWPSLSSTSEKSLSKRWRTLTHRFSLLPPPSCGSVIVAGMEEVLWDKPRVTSYNPSKHIKYSNKKWITSLGRNKLWSTVAYGYLFFIHWYKKMNNVIQ